MQYPRAADASARRQALSRPLTVSLTGRALRVNTEGVPSVRRQDARLSVSFTLISEYEINQSFVKKDKRPAPMIIA